MNEENLDDLYDLEYQKNLKKYSSINDMIEKEKEIDEDEIWTKMLDPIQYYEYKAWQEQYGKRKRK